MQVIIKHPKGSIMRKTLSSITLAILLLASNSSFAVNVVCFNTAAPNPINCFVYLYSHEISNSHNGVLSSADLNSTDCPANNGNAWHIVPKPSSTTMPSNHWTPGAPTCWGDVLHVFAVQVHNWGGIPQGYFEYADWDTQDEDWGGAG
jgi:hypothetical protein